MLLNAGSYRDLPAARLRRWLRELLVDIAPAAGSLGVRFCGDRAMRAANRRFRGHDRVTDVLSFPAAEATGEAEGRHLGDILICVPQARRQAAAGGETLERELEALLLHGILHCQGHDHETDSGEMERLERRLRRRWVGRGP